MPIKGLTNREEAFPQIGDIRKGDRGGKNGAPRDLNYFRVEAREGEREATAALSGMFADLVDGKPTEKHMHPTEIDILFPMDDIDRCFECYYEAYVAGGLVYRSDGEYILREVNPATGECIVNSAAQRVPHRQNPIGHYVNDKGKREEIKYKPTGRMKVILPGLRRLAYFVVHTTSIHDVMNISAQLRAIVAIHGKLAGVPLVLRRRPHKISMPGPDEKRVRRTKWLLSVEADPAWVSKKIEQLSGAAMPVISAPAAMIAAPFIENGKAALDGPEYTDVLAPEDDEEDGGFVEQEEAEEPAKKTRAELIAELRALLRNMPAEKQPEPLGNGATDEQIQARINSLLDAQAQGGA